jgi:hypothetical protein
MLMEVIFVGLAKTEVEIISRAVTRVNIKSFLPLAFLI